LRLALLGLCALALAGCNTVPHRLSTILVPCQTAKVEPPSFPFDTLSVDADIFTKVKTLLADRKVRQGYEDQLETANEACRK
jgi:hypothetical protein